MKPGTELVDAWRGWAEIVAGRDDAHRSFVATVCGLVVALGWFVVAMLLSTAIQSAISGMPAVEQVLAGFVEQVLALALAAFVIGRSLRFLKLEVPLLAVLVPIVYALAFTFVLAIPLSMLGPNVALLAVLLLGMLIYRLGRIVAGMSMGTAAAFAVLCLLVLVVARYALYMVIHQLPSPA